MLLLLLFPFTYMLSFHTRCSQCTHIICALLSQEHKRQLNEKQEQICTLEGQAKESSQEVHSLKAEVSALNLSMTKNSSLVQKYEHDIVTLQEEKKANEAVSVTFIIVSFHIHAIISLNLFIMYSHHMHCFCLLVINRKLGN